MTCKLRAVPPVRYSAELHAIVIAAPASCGLSIQSSADGIILQQFIAQTLAPSLLMAHPPQAKVHRATPPLTRIIAADVMPEHVMRQNHAVTGLPPKHFDFKTRVIGGSGSPLGYPAIRGGSFDGSPLPTHHFLDPDRGEG